MTIRVSVVMATFNSGPALEDVFKALDNQTLSRDHYEIVAVDDGSTDDTFDLLSRMRSERPNVVVERIANSGWPGRPRNIGTGLASGEYVLFMDHDDYIFPEALERLHAFAVASQADVVVGKEVVAGSAVPGHTTWRTNEPRTDGITPALIELMTPHKLYRREFLRERGIAFPEGRIRLEDYDFNAQAYSQTDAIAIYSEYPCYRWNIHAGSSHRRGFDEEVYWRSFERSVMHIEQNLPPGRDQDNLLVRWYRSRILGRLGPKFFSYSERYRHSVLDYGSKMLPHFPARLDEQLMPAERARSSLLRRHDYDGLVALSELDRRIGLVVRQRSVEWREGGLDLEFDVSLEAADGSFDLVAHRGRLLRVLPPDLAGRIPSADLDLTDAVLSSECVVFVRGRSTSTDWIVPATWEPSTSGPDGRPAVRGLVRCRLDPATAAFGEPLVADAWDMSVRLVGPGYTGTVRVRAGGMRASPAVVDEASMVAYTTKKGHVALDIGSKVRTVLGSPRPGRRSGRVAWREGSNHLTLSLDAVHWHTDQRFEGRLVVGDHEFPAHLASQDGRAVMTASFLVPEGMYDVRGEFFGRRSTALLRVDVAASGRARVRSLPGEDVRARSAVKARRLMGGVRRRIRS